MKKDLCNIIVSDPPFTNRAISEWNSINLRILGNAAGQVKTYGKEKFNELTKSSLNIFAQNSRMRIFLIGPWIMSMPLKEKFDR